MRGTDRHDHVIGVRVRPDVMRDVPVDHVKITRADVVDHSPDGDRSPAFQAQQQVIPRVRVHRELITGFHVQNVRA
jgi:hypothetical protein